MNNNWGKLHVTFVTNFCNELSKSNIRYFILRNYENLPENNNGKDVDVVIEPSKYREVKELLLQTMKDLGIHYYTITQFDRMRCWYIMDLGQEFSIHIDIIENEVYKGFEFFKFDDLYTHTVKYKDFVVLDKTADTIMLIVQNLVAYKNLKPKYRNTIQNNYNLNVKEIDKALLIFFGENVGNEVIAFLKKNDFDSIVGIAHKLERTVMKRIFKQRPFYTIKNIIRFLIGKFYRIIWCPHKFWRFFAVVAPDGTGKTTFINNLIASLSFYYVSDPVRFQIHHFRPTILPNLGAIGERTGVMKQDTNFTNPHRARSAGTLSSFFRMLYYWLDYVIGMPYLLRKEVQYERYTIFDRYIYDFLVDPRRSRIDLPYWVRKIFTKLVLQPQIVFVLDADTEVIYNRKQELTKKEINRQLILFRSLSTSGKRFVRLDANKSPDEITNQAIKTIFEFFLIKV